MPPDDPPHAEQASEKPSLVGRLRNALAAVRGLPAWAKTHRLLAAAVGGGALVAITCVVTLALVLAKDEEEIPPEVLLEQAFAALDAGDRTTAAELAEKLRDAKSLLIDDISGPPYILGIIAGERADESWGRDKPTLHLLAASLLKESHDHGFPPSREAEGAYQLGRHLYLAGKIAASRSPLKEAIGLQHPRAHEIHGLLAEVNLRDPNPRWKDALEHNAEYLKHPELAPEQRQSGLLQRGRAQLSLGDLAGCRETLAQLPPDSNLRSEAAVLRAQALMREADASRTSQRPPEAPLEPAAADKYRQAIAILREAQENDTLRSQSTPKAMLLIGLCYMKLDDDRAAQAQFQSVLKRFSGGPEATAAEFHVAELSRKMGRTEQAIAGYRRTLATINSGDGEGNPWLSMAELRTSCQAAYEDLLRQRQFGAAVELAKLLSPLIPADRALEWEARAYQEWGRWLGDRAAAAAPVEAPALVEQSLVQFRHAGRVFIRLARLRIATRDYPDDLWSGVESYLAGHDYKNAIKVLNEYLKIEQRRRRPSALVGLGEAFLAQDEPAQALEVLRRAIDDFPHDPASFQARLLASDAYLAKGAVEPAETVLTANLDDSLLTPASQEWRDSLFALGRLLYRAGRYDDAIKRLDEAVSRYPTDKQSLEARYLLATAYAHSAYDPQPREAGAATSRQRTAQGRRVEQTWSAALEQYDKLVQEIVKRQDEKPLSADEKAMLRNGYFGRAEALFELGRFEPAIKAYSEVVNRYQSEPEVLDAYLQLSECYRRLRQPAEARGALEQAKIVLAQLKDGARFTEATNFRRDEWVNLLNALTAN